MIKDLVIRFNEKEELLIVLEECEFLNGVDIEISSKKNNFFISQNKNTIVNIEIDNELQKMINKAPSALIISIGSDGIFHTYHNVINKRGE